MGVSRVGLDSGTALTRLAVVGCALALAGFVIPVASDFDHYHFAWAVEPGSLALYFPLLAIVIGAAVAIAPLPHWLIGSALAATGAFGLLSSSSLGAFAATGTRGLPLLTIALVLGSAAVIERLFTPTSRLARRVLLGAGGLAFAGMLLPIGEPHDVLHAEMLFFHEHLEDSHIPLVLFRSGAASGGHLTFFIGYFALAPLALLPAAAAAAQIAPTVWDRGAMTLRPVAWLLVLFYPLTMALGIFNLMGWEHVSWVSYGEHLVAAKDFTQAAMTGRAKLLLLDTTYSLWAAFGLVLLYRSRAHPPIEDGAADAGAGANEDAPAE